MSLNNVLFLIIQTFQFLLNKINLPSVDGHAVERAVVHFASP